MNFPQHVDREHRDQADDRRWRKARAIWGVTLAVTAALWSSAAVAGPTMLTYIGYLAGVPVLNLTAQISIPVSGSAGLAAPQNGPYQMDAAIGTVGNLAVLYPFRAELFAKGRMSIGRPTPGLFKSTQSIWQKQESTTLAYDGAGDVTLTANPLTKLGQQVVRSGNANNTMDPMSAVLALIGAFSQRNACGGSYAVFDGVRRYDIAVEQIGKATVNALQQSYYQGPATECRAAPSLVGGFQQQAVQSQLYPQSARLWLARPIKGYPAVPVRIAAENALGEMVLDLVGVQ